MTIIDSYDISILTETVKVDTSKINIEGLWDFLQVRPKHQHVISHSGGITILAKYIFRPGSKLLKTQWGSFGFAEKQHNKCKN